MLEQTDGCVDKERAPDAGCEEFPWLKALHSVCPDVDQSPHQNGPQDAAQKSGLEPTRPWLLDMVVVHCDQASLVGVDCCDSGACARHACWQ